MTGKRALKAVDTEGPHRRRNGSAAAFVCRFLLSQEVYMKRFVLAAVVACLGAYSVLAASPKVASAVKTFKAIGSDAGKVKTFCEMVQTMDASGEKDDPAAEAKITGLMKQLGPDFETAWNAGEGLDDSTDDGKAFNAAMDDLAEKCPQ
jgi:hypothetical protein